MTWPLSSSDTTDDVCARRVGEQHLERVLDLVGQGRIDGDEVACRSRIVLGLRHQIDRDEVRDGSIIGEHEHLARTREHVDPALSHHELLGCGHIRVARADDLVHTLDRVGPVGESGDGLCAPDLVDLVDTGFCGGGEREGTHGAVRCRRNHHRDLIDTRHLGWDRVHEHGARVAGTSAGDVDAQRDE